MNQSHIKIFIGVTLFLAFLVWLTSYFFQGFDIISFSSLKSFFASFSFVSLFWLVYFKWAWRWPYLRKIMYKPDLGGTWLGHFESNWKNPKGYKNPPKKFVLVVRQSWLSVSIRAFTENQKTHSYIESFIFDEDKGSKILAYLYSEKESRSEYSSRQGAAELELSEGGATRVLEGHFWTISGTQGFVRVKFVCPNEKVESIQIAIEKWSNPKDWEKLNQAK